MINKGTYVEILQIVLEPEERSTNLPEETKRTQLKLWAKGFLEEDCELFDTGKIKTATGRILEGIVCETSPTYTHGFGDFIPEVMYIGAQAKALLWGEEYE